MSSAFVKAFNKQVKKYRNSYRRFLTRIEKKTTKGLDKIVAPIDKEVWKETDCLACANCCRTMTPTYTLADIKRISAHLGMTVDEFKNKWLYKERSTGDWMNKKTPCQFLDLKTNMCNIYEVRPADCAGFPHHTKRHFKEWVHVYKQNVEYCPATFKLVEKMKAKIDNL
ncbi:MAG: YkgJ family cysteine cluster protein [Sphingobacteriales bacterium]|nr:YkgJ family cysteine cluster protein [Sphingobacteriales bacterium]MBI3718516.1 YkgJ family cysteine cluster protein [Sphingobacteriales bacterium]